MPAHADPPARQAFGAVQTPAALTPSAIGSPAKGCLAGAKPLPTDGPHWQVMRPSRHRYFGHPNLVSYIERLAEAAAGEGWPGILVGDMAQPRGGPMTSGHASHQTGIDADLWLKPAPDHPLDMAERESLPLVSVLKPGTRELDPELWSDAQARFIKRAASEPEVARIFVNPVIKKALCDAADRLRGRPGLAEAGAALVGSRRPHPRPSEVPGCGLCRAGPAACRGGLRRGAHEMAVEDAQAAVEASSRAVVFGPQPPARLSCRSVRAGARRLG